MARTVTEFTTVDLELVDCSNCGVVFGLPVRIATSRRETGGTFYCPNGHALAWKTSEVERLREEVKRARAATVAAQDQREAAERSKAALRGVITRERRRVGNGVCPCCKRTFKDLARHMTGKHPGFADSSPAE
jgi:hypothetical protein